MISHDGPARLPLLVCAALLPLLSCRSSEPVGETPTSPAPAKTRRAGAPCAEGADCFERLSVEQLCSLHYEIPDVRDVAPEDPCVTEGVVGRIPIQADRPVGGMSVVAYRVLDDLDRVDFRVTFRSFDARQPSYLQFYQGTIARAGFYFGIQNRAVERDRILIFTRWFNDDEVAALLGIDKVPGCKDLKAKPERNKAFIYRHFFATHPGSAATFDRYVRACVRTNAAAGGFDEVSTSEGAFAGVRLPKFTVGDGESLVFSIAREADDDGGTWYAYRVRDDGGARDVWAGSLRFPKGGLIDGYGRTWTEIFGQLVQTGKRPDGCQ